MKYIPLVALLLCQTSAIGAEELPALNAQVTPYNAPQIILAQEGEDDDTDDAKEADAGSRVRRQHVESRLRSGRGVYMDRRGWVCL